MNIGIHGNIYPAGKTKGDTYSWFVLTYMDGLKRNGHNVFGINYRSTDLKEVENIIRTNKIKVLFTHLTFHKNIFSLEMILSFYKTMRKKYGVKIIHVLGDARKEDRYMGNIKDYIDMAFVSNTDVLINCKKTWGIPVFFTAYPALTQNKLANIDKRLSFNIPVFTGHPGAHVDRTAFINELQKNIPIKIIRTQSEGDLRNKTPELSISAKCILGLCTGYDINHFTDVRPWQYLGSGACMIIRKFKKMDDLIPEDIYYPIDGYNIKNINKIKELFEEIKKTNTMNMREKAFNFIQKHHSSKVRLKNIMNVIEEKQDTVKIFLKEL